MTDRLAPCTVALIAVTVAASYRGFHRPAFMQRYLFTPMGVLREGQVHRLITSAFLHADWGHLLFNMFSLYVFGHIVEFTAGIPHFLAIYFTAVVGGGLLALFVHRHHAYQALGASGGVCGVIFAAIFLSPGGRIRLLLFPVPMPYWVYAILFLVLSYIALRRRADAIGHDAHIGGAIVGLLTTTALYPGIVRVSPWLYAAVMTLAVAILASLVWRPLGVAMPDFLRPGVWRQRRTRARKESDAKTLDRLLDKVSREGIQSLTPSEQRRLEEISKRQRKG